MLDIDLLHHPLANDPRLMRPEIKAAFAVMSARMRRVQAERLTSGRTEWPAWLRECFPGFFSADFATHHQMFWEHIWSIKPEVRPKPFLAVWPRGGGKSSSAEVSTIMLGVHGERHYALYVSGTQDQADKHVESIAGLLESSAFAARYPTFANRRLGKYGHSRGWRRNRLHTEPGFMIDAAGLDRAVRGIKAEQVRPDVIIFDDLDDLLDSPATVTKKIKVLTRSILPAGSNDVAIIGVQNLIHEGSIFTMLATHKTDFLLDHIMSGPIPAVRDLEYQLDTDGTYEIIAGEPTWEGQNLEQCQALIDDIGLSAFLIESQHNVEDTKGGIYEHIEFQHCDWSQMPTLERIVVWVDPAVTNTDDSDSHGIQADGLGVNGKLYRLFSWEGRTSPEESLKRAILKAIELKASHVGVETDQGGDTWKTVYDSTVRELQANGLLHGIQGGPGFTSAKAGAGHGPKAHRQAQMLSAYERGEIIHVRGTHSVLERALKRFGVRKPYDLADSCLAEGTMIETITGPIPIEDIQPGMFVLTRYGYCEVQAAGLTQESAQLYALELEDGRILEGTGNHPIYVETKGWITIDSLCCGDILFVCPDEKRLSSTELPITDIQTRKNDRFGCISNQANMGVSTEQSGLMPMEQSQQIDATRYTTKTITPITIHSRILNCSPSDSINNNMIRHQHLKPWPVSRGFDQTQHYGMDHVKGSNGIAFMVNGHGTEKPIVCSSAPYARNHFGHGARDQIHIPASNHDADISFGKHMFAVEKRGCVTGAHKPLLQSDVMINDIATVAVRRVQKHMHGGTWNLSVAEHPEYFANGILVHNCYWAWYDLCGRRKWLPVDD